MGSICAPDSQPTENGDEQKEQKERPLPKKDYALSVIDAFNGRPGFYSQSYMVRCQYKDFIDNITSIPPENAKEIPMKWVTLTGFVAGADGLAKEERDMAIEGAQMWSGGNASAEELGEAIDKGAKMTVEEAIAFAKDIAQGTGADSERAHIPILYYSLVVSRADGLSKEEKNHFVEIAKAMGCSEDLIQELINTYLLEVKYAKSMESLMKGKLKRQFSVGDMPDTWDL